MCTVNCAPSFQTDVVNATRHCTGGDGTPDTATCGVGYPNAADPIGCNYQRIGVQLEGVHDCTPRIGGNITAPNQSGFFILERDETCTPLCVMGYVIQYAPTITFGTTTHFYHLICHYTRAFSPHLLGPVANCNGPLLRTTAMPIEDGLVSGQVSLRVGEMCTVNCAPSFQVDITVATRECTGGDGSPNSGTCGPGYPNAADPIGCNFQRVGVYLEGITDCTPRSGGNITAPNQMGFLFSSAPRRVPACA